MDPIQGRAIEPSLGRQQRADLGAREGREVELDQGRLTPQAAQHAQPRSVVAKLAATGQQQQQQGALAIGARNEMQELR